MTALYHVTQLLLFPTRVCNICHTEKFLEFDFYKSPPSKDGRELRCIACRYAQERARKGTVNHRKGRANRTTEKQDEQTKREKQRAYCRHYHREHREQII